MIAQTCIVIKVRPTFLNDFHTLSAVLCNHEVKSKVRNSLFHK